MEEMDTSEETDPFYDEFTSWQVEPTCSGSPEKIILMDKITRDEEGKASIAFSIDKQNFVLHCPTNYPEYQDENFFVEAEPGLQLWCNALNEFLLDSSDSLRLSSILNKSLSLYSRGDSRNRTESCSMRGSDDDSSPPESGSELSESEDGQLDDMLDKDFNWGLEVARMKKKWKIKEEELRSEARNGKALDSEEGMSLSEVYHDSTMKNSQPKQVFTSAAASGILTNDLLAIMDARVSQCDGGASAAAGPVSGVEADTVADNIFQWNVRLSNFTGTQLGEDLKKIEADFGYNYIELQLDFSMDLYPFFPPLVKVIRPRLQGSMMLRVTTMEILKLTYWDPARDMMSVLKDIRNFLSTWARLDTASERNDRTRYPSGAYIDIEHHLLRLALVSEIIPRANKKYTTSVPTTVKLPPTAVENPYVHVKPKKEEKKEKKEEKKFLGLTFSQKTKSDKKREESPTKKMAKGVGYSTYNNKGWDVKAFQAAQQEKDKQIELVLEKILLELKRLHYNQSTVGRNLPDVINGSSGPPSVDVNSESQGRSNGSRRKRKHSPDEDQEEADDSPVNPMSDLYAVLEGSALIPFLESKLQANSFLEIGRHTAVYRMVIGIINELRLQSSLVSLLGPLPDQTASIHSLLQNLESQARIMINRIGKASANGSVPKPEKARRAGAAARVPGTGEEASLGGDTLAKEFLVLSTSVTQALKTTGYLPDINAEGTSGAENHQPQPPDQPQLPEQQHALHTIQHSVPETSNNKGEREKSMENLYISTLSQFQFDTVDFPETGKFAHCHQIDYNKSGTPSYQVICRVAQDISSLAAQGSLPMNFSSSIFVRSDDDKSTLLKAIITGPDDTPYTGGIYEFDIYFPNKYPSVPPKVTFRTTGNGTVRFNPNLYNDGKVCLSLLGTWEGAQGEQWCAETSTILQVLISIQSLILCKEPYYNEPGFERQYGTSVGNAESNKYNEEVFRNNLKFAILDQISSPPDGFEDVIRAHFYIKRQSLIEEIESQGLEYKCKSLKKLLAEVTTLLRNMKRPSCVKEEL